MTNSWIKRLVFENLGALTTQSVFSRHDWDLTISSKTCIVTFFKYVYLNQIKVTSLKCSQQINKVNFKYPAVAVHTYPLIVFYSMCLIRKRI